MISKLGTFAGCLLIAAAILITNHWQITPVGSGGLWRLDRWTGRLYICGKQLAPNGGYLPAVCTE
jgi:hypothetical protein